MTASRTRALLTLLLCLWGLSIAGAGQASAHDRLVGSDPANGATVAAPENVTLTYSAEILPTGALVRVTGPDDSVASSGDPKVSGTKVVQQVDASAPGKYSVAWRVTSSDGHPISGTFAFTVQPEGAAPPPGEDTTAGGGGEAPATSPWQTDGSGTTSESTLEPTTRVGADETSNQPLLVIGLAVATLLVVLGGALYARGRLRDDD